MSKPDDEDCKLTHWTRYTKAQNRHDVWWRQGARIFSRPPILNPQTPLLLYLYLHTVAVAVVPVPALGFFMTGLAAALAAAGFFRGVVDKEEAAGRFKEEDEESAGFEGEGAGFEGEGAHGAAAGFGFAAALVLAADIFPLPFPSFPFPFGRICLGASSSSVSSSTSGRVLPMETTANKWEDKNPQKKTWAAIT